MKRFITGVVGIGSATLLMASALYAGPTDDPRIQKREQNQEKRIEQGEKSGQLTPREAGRLERQQTKIKQDEERMKSDGKLTKQERKKLTREQNRASRNIYKEKHDKQKTNVSR
jgi:uncharacterized protein HemX